MPELAPLERLQPALLDRLTDEEPDRRQESPEERVLNKTRLRSAVLRDLAWLFNTTRPGPWDEYHDVERSVLAYGLPALAGETASALDVPRLEREIRKAIHLFEPRILPASVTVEALVSDLELDHHNVISIQIRGQLWAQPVPLELLLRTSIDLESGAVEVRDVGSGG